MSTYTITAGNTFTSIASAFNTTVSAIEAANPGVNPTTLQVGQVINLPGQPVVKYTIVSGDTLNAIASKLNTTVATLESVNPGINPNNLQVGQIINLPGVAAAPAVPNTPSPAPSSAPPANPTTPNITYTIVSGDTFTSIAAKLNTSVGTLEGANPGVDPTRLKVGQIINLPSSAPATTQTPISPALTPARGTSVGAAYVFYSGPASNFPPQSSWADYDTLWASNSKLMTYNDTASQVAVIGQAILSTSAASGIDARAILCIIMQESGGNVHVGNTTSPDGVNNTGIMQAHNGGVFDPSNEAGSITQMIRDGTMGTSSGDGLAQTFKRFGNYYEAFRAYNSGSVDQSNLSNGLGATNDYVSKVANRLLGHIWAGM